MLIDLPLGSSSKLDASKFEALYSFIAPIIEHASPLNVGGELIIKEELLEAVRLTLLSRWYGKTIDSEALTSLMAEHNLVLNSSSIYINLEKLTYLATSHELNLLATKCMQSLMMENIYVNGGKIFHQEVI